MAHVGRLAPTPSGRLHLGNVCAFAGAWLSPRAQGGRVLLRIEDVDKVRADRAVEDSLRADLIWLGLTWDEETPRQSERDYAGPRRPRAIHLLLRLHARGHSGGGVVSIPGPAAIAG